MKKWLKSEVCGSHEQCINALFIGEKSNLCGLKKKKKNVILKRRHAKC